MLPSVLVAGMDRPDNPFTRMLAETGFRPIHVSHFNNKEIPNVDSAIVAINNCGHDLSEKIKREMKTRNKKVFWAKQGTSSIKEEFSKHYFIPVREMLKPISTQLSLAYLLGLINTPGKPFRSSRFLQLCANFLGEVKIHNWNSFQMVCNKTGIISKMVGPRGTWKFNGLDNPTIDKLVSFGIPVPDDWKIDYQKSKPIEKVVYATPIQVVEKEEPKQKVEIDEVTTNENIELLLSVISDMSTKLEEVNKNVNLRLFKVNEKVDNLTRSINPSGKNDIIPNIVEKLKNLSYSELYRIWTMLEFAERRN